MTIDLGATYELQTIVFLTDRSDNVESLMSFSRLVGMSSDPSDASLTLLAAPDMNYSSMVADLNSPV